MTWIEGCLLQGYWRVLQTGDRGSHSADTQLPGLQLQADGVEWLRSLQEAPMKVRFGTRGRVREAEGTAQETKAVNDDASKCHLEIFVK